MEFILFIWLLSLVANVIGAASAFALPAMVGLGSIFIGSFIVLAVKMRQ